MSAQAIEEDEPRAAPTLAGSALWYAEQGILVFPLRPGTKVPATRHGVNDASTDASMVAWWWGMWPDANIGLATGHTFDVVDIDGPTGQASRVAHWCYDEACRAAGSLPTPPADWTPECEHEGVFNRVARIALAHVSTPRPGGMHIYVPAQGDGNKAGVFPGIDYRGLGGYVVAPPSRITEGPNPGGYSFLGTPTLTGVRA